MFLKKFEFEAEGTLELKYDPEWLRIVFSTMHLFSTSTYMRMPVIGGKERFDFRPSQQEIHQIATKDSLKIPVLGIDFFKKRVQKEEDNRQKEAFINHLNAVNKIDPVQSLSQVDAEEIVLDIDDDNDDNDDNNDGIDLTQMQLAQEQLNEMTDNNMKSDTNFKTSLGSSCSDLVNENASTTETVPTLQNNSISDDLKGKDFDTPNAIADTQKDPNVSDCSSPSSEKCTRLQVFAKDATKQVKEEQANNMFQSNDFSENLSQNTPLQISQSNAQNDVKSCCDDDTLDTPHKKQRTN